VLRVEVMYVGAAIDVSDAVYPSYETSGVWGLGIVELLAPRWGMERLSDGVRVWFEVDRPRKGSWPAAIDEGPPPLSLRTTQEGEQWTVALGGEVDLYHSTTVKLEFERILDLTPAPAVLFVDLAQVTFIDSIGIAVLLFAHARAASRGCRFTLSAMSPVVAAVLRMSGLTDTLSAEGAG